ncbi:MAG: hypothetical protein AUK47_01730 [Deltaproteobacteria bacterium CG2_30_63_29]|nr:MAG: hypothetical protein AUK47_01730 [Deltaproteobacteria bacterium CG2_30_63_29]PJB45683.1 MAG: hypothetical protein CO108_06885 [Deltaproteobacteria bacterium CG_4_9_14_3_um_filter_63_12]
MISFKSASWLTIAVWVCAAFIWGCGDTSTSTPRHQDVLEDGSVDLASDVGVDVTEADQANDTELQDLALDESAEVLSCEPGVVTCSNACCTAGQTCVAGVCTDACSDGKPRCGNDQVCCPGTLECVLGACAAGCNSGVRCGPTQTCCAANEVCDDQAGACVLACPTQVFCGAQQTCCGAGELCFVETCVAPGIPCQENYQCPAGEYCETTIGNCLPIAALPGCFYIPTEDFLPEVEWEWSGSTVEPDYHQVMMAPAVANMTDDNGDGLIDTHDIPDVVFSTFTGSQYTATGYIRVVSGDTGQELMVFTQSQVAGASSVAIGDIDGDDRPEVIASLPSYAGVIAFEDNGDIKWQRPGVYMGWGGASLVDLDQNGDVEILASGSMIDHTGVEVWNTAASGCGNGRQIPVAADIDRDPSKRAEVVTGLCILDGFGNVLFRLKDSTGANWASDGFPAIGNFDAEPHPELVTVSGGAINLFSWDGTWRWSVPGPGGSLGPPTIGNFIDDDPQPEIAVAGASNYVIIDEVDDGTGKMVGQIVFSKATQDQSSNVTGSSIFDFEGDGIAEAVYNDECFIHVYDTRLSAADPLSDKFMLPNTSGTTHEYPIIVDVDNDGNAELIAIRNDYAPSITTACLNWPGFDVSGAGHGVRVFGDRKDNWVSTRRIWNQHAYSITNVTENGKIPQVADRNIDVFNNFRQNAQSDGLFFAPDLTLENLDFDISACPAQLTLTVDVNNDGAQGVGSGVPVSFYLVNADGSRTYLGTSTTTAVMLPGNFETVSFTWDIPLPLQGGSFEFVVVVDDPGDGSSVNNECHEDNNELSTSAAVACLDIT